MSSRITLTLRADTLEAVRALARQERRDTAAMARVLIERGLAGQAIERALLAVVSDIDHAGEITCATAELVTDALEGRPCR